jgi:hypothetical protein
MDLPDMGPQAGVIQPTPHFPTAHMQARLGWGPEGSKAVGASLPVDPAQPSSAACPTWHDRTPTATTLAAPCEGRAEAEAGDPISLSLLARTEHQRPRALERGVEQGLGRSAIVAPQEEATPGWSDGSSMGCGGHGGGGGAGGGGDAPCVLRGAREVGPAGGRAGCGTDRYRDPGPSSWTGSALAGSAGFGDALGTRGGAGESWRTTACAPAPAASSDSAVGTGARPAVADLVWFVPGVAAAERSAQAEVEPANN